MTTEQLELKAKRESIAKNHVEAENRHDVDAAIATFHKPRYEVQPMGIIHDGKEAVDDLLSGVFTVEIVKTNRRESIF